MPSSQEPVLCGDIFEEFAVLSLEDLSRMCAVDRQRIIELVEEGVLSVMEVNAPAWRFRGDALRRARIAVRLQQDLDLNLAGVALALQLMEELAELRRELKALT